MTRILPVASLDDRLARACVHRKCAAGRQQPHAVEQRQIAEDVLEGEVLEEMPGAQPRAQRAVSEQRLDLGSEQQQRTDFLDLAAIWSNLHVRVASANERAAARGEKNLGEGLIFR